MGEKGEDAHVIVRRDNIRWAQGWSCLGEKKAERTSFKVLVAEKRRREPRLWVVELRQITGRRSGIRNFYTS